MKLSFEIKDIVLFGWLPSTREEREANKGRWIVWDAPWTEDVREFDCPKRLCYFGKRWCWSFGAHTQRYDWKLNRFKHWGNNKNWARFTIHPRDYRERWERDCPNPNLRRK